MYIFRRVIPVIQLNCTNVEQRACSALCSYSKFKLPVANGWVMRDVLVPSATSQWDAFQSSVFAHVFQKMEQAKQAKGAML